MNLDKTKWIDGPWTNEADRVEFVTAAGLPAIVKRSAATGALCGYVGAKPAKRKAYALKVHGGITYEAPCNHDCGVCHVPAPGEPEDLTWFGFDCAHAFDATPVLSTMSAEAGIELQDASAVYRDVAYVQAECERLAAQLMAAAE